MLLIASGSAMLAIVGRTATHKIRNKAAMSVYTHLTRLHANYRRCSCFKTTNAKDCMTSWSIVPSLVDAVILVHIFEVMPPPATAETGLATVGAVRALWFCA